MPTPKTLGVTVFCALVATLAAPGVARAAEAPPGRVSVSLAAGASAVERMSYYFVGQVQPVPLLTHQFLGPMSDNWQASGQTPVDSLGFSPCDAKRELHVNTEIRVVAGTSDPATTTSSITETETASDLYHLTWKRCA
jgi:hypothetical protein